MLAKSLIDHDLPKWDAKRVCYFFFKDDNPEQVCASNALCAILHQLFSSRKELLRHALTDFSRSGPTLIRNISRLWGILLRVAKDPLAGEIICVLDALDECEPVRLELLIRLMVDFYERTMVERERNSILKFLVTSRFDLKIERMLNAGSHEIKSIHLSDSATIRVEIDLFIKHETIKIGRQLKLKETVRQSLEDELKKKDNLTYLWLHLILEVIRNSIGVTQTHSLVELINTIPSSVNSAYERILERASDPQRAIEALRIILCSRRPLTVGEMNHALAAARTGLLRDLEPDEDDEHFKSTIRIRCGLFIRILESDRIYLLHDTARSFLLDHMSDDRDSRLSAVWGLPLKEKECECFLAKICVTYLSKGAWFQTLSVDKIKSPHLIESGDAPLLDYAAHHWGDHVRGDAEKIFQAEILELLSQCSKIDLIFRIIWLQERLDESYWMAGFKVPTHTPAILAASFLGLEKTVRLLAEDPTSLGARSSEGATAIHWAVWKDEKSIVQFLVNAGADPDAQDEGGNTSLHIAASKGHVVLLDQFLELGVNLNGRNNAGQTALHMAVANGHIAVLERLLSKGANVLSCDNQKRHALHYAIDTKFHGTNVNIVRMLLQHGFTDETADIDNMTPLHLAVRCSQADVVNMLLDHALSIDVAVQRRVSSHISESASVPLGLRDSDTQKCQRGPLHVGYTPLHAAALFGHASMVALLLSRGANANIQGEYGETPLHLALSASIDGPKIEDAWTEPLNYVEGAIDIMFPNADDDDDEIRECIDNIAKMRRDAIVTLLDAPGTDVKIQDAFGRTCLHVIRYDFNKASEHVTKLLEKGCDLKTSNNKGVTAVHLAARKGDHESLDVYLGYHADPMMSDALGRNLIHHACAGRAGYSSFQTVQILLEGILASNLLSSTDSQGQNCLHHAVSKCANTELVQLLLDQGVDVNMIDNHGRSPIMTAIISAPFCPEQDIIRRLLKAGAFPHIVDSSGQNLAHMLMSSGHKVETGTLFLLADYRVPISTIDMQGRTVLHHAAAAGTLDRTILQALLKRWRLDVNAKDNNGRTALDHAIMQACMPCHPLLFDSERWARTRDVLRDFGAHQNISHASAVELQEEMAFTDLLDGTDSLDGTDYA